MALPGNVSRRELFGYAAALVIVAAETRFNNGAAAARLIDNARPERAVAGNELLELTITELVHAFESRDVSAIQYAQAVAERAEQLKDLNAFISFDEALLFDAARKADTAKHARGRLNGVPIVVKDNIACRGYPLTGGTPSLQRHFPDRNAAIVQRLLDAGGLVAGKANLHELGMGEIGTNAYFGRSKNPYSPRMVTGGSSGGTAAAVAARIVPGGLGTDTGGSVRVPAALCGLVGFRPSVGRYPREGIVPMSATRDTAGTMARSVSDIALLDRVITEDLGGGRTLAPVKLEGLRLGVPRQHFYGNLDDEVSEAIEGVLRVLSDNGAVLVEEPLATVVEIHDEISFPIILYEMARDLGKWLEANVSDMSLEELVQGIQSEDVRALIPEWYGEGAVAEHTYLRAIRQRLPVLRKAYADHFSRFRIDGLLFPTTAQPARILNEDWSLRIDAGSSISTRIYGQNVGPGSLAGIPGITLPVSLTRAGLPVALGIDGLHGNDPGLLDVAAGIEAALPRIPPPDIPT